MAAGDVYVIYNSSANASIVAVGDIAHAVTFYNGDDTVALLKNDVVIDVIGVIGTDPGTNWVVGTGATIEFTLVRKSSVKTGVTTFDPSQWDVYSQDTVSYLGSHTQD